MQLKKGQIIELNIDAIAFEGAGIGQYEGLKVFVPDTMAGDRVKASLTRIKKNFAQARLVEILQASRERVEPKCRHFGSCGGCHLQFVPYELQLKLKKQHVIDCLNRIGHIKNPPVSDVLGCEEQFGYRNKMEFSFGYDAEMNFCLGLHERDRKFDIADLSVCHLLAEEAFKIVDLTRKIAKEKNWEPFMFSCGKGVFRSLFIREGKGTGEILVNIATSQNVFENFSEDLEKWVSALLELNLGKKKIVSIYWTKMFVKRGFKSRQTSQLLYGKNFLTEKMRVRGKELRFEIYPQSFFQVNTAQAEKLYSEIMVLAGLRPHEIAFDLFCGTGTISLFLAQHAGQVFGIEINEDSVKAARVNALKNGIFNADFFVGDVLKRMREIKVIPSLIVVDPPRAGLCKNTIAKINEFSPEQIIYVSCNPATLARDCEILGEYGYCLESVKPVDMFPHTYHIECVCLLGKK